MTDKKYNNCMKLTQQFRFCPNAFRVDTYKGCDYGCKYCFANADAENFKSSKYEFFKLANLKQVEDTFKKAFETDFTGNNLNVELLRHRVPLHCGGMADPFQRKEFEYHQTYKLIEISNKYNYPIIFSTKTDHLPEEYWEILNPEIHAFQISMIGWSDEFVRTWETNTPLASNRLNFLKELRDKGFWCSIRLQPLIDIKEAVTLLEQAKEYPSYVTVEHLRLPTPHVSLFKEFMKYYENKEDIVNQARMFGVATNKKRENIDILKEIAHKYGYKLGIGDNDLHYLSESRCCCGIDCINDNFNNYLKYNVTYMSTGDYSKKDLWYPKSDCKKVMNQKLYGHKKFVGYEELLKEYLIKNEVLDSENKKKLERTVFKFHQKTLF